MPRCWPSSTLGTYLVLRKNSTVIDTYKLPPELEMIKAVAGVALQTPITVQTVSSSKLKVIWHLMNASSHLYPGLSVVERFEIEVSESQNASNVRNVVVNNTLPEEYGKTGFEFIVSKLKPSTKYKVRVHAYTCRTNSSGAEFISPYAEKRTAALINRNEDTTVDITHTFLYVSIEYKLQGLQLSQFDEDSWLELADKVFSPWDVFVVDLRGMEDKVVILLFQVETVAEVVNNLVSNLTLFPTDGSLKSAFQDIGFPWDNVNASVFSSASIHLEPLEKLLSTTTTQTASSTYTVTIDDRTSISFSATTTSSSMSTTLPSTVTFESSEARTTDTLLVSQMFDFSYVRDVSVEFRMLEREPKFQQLGLGKLAQYPQLNHHP
eukprot:m.125147 g.125147  ORF g.125147 m.125147 type:complete len:379 (-) comp14489_c0_seq4:404-1540(-)